MFGLKKRDMQGGAGGRTGEVPVITVTLDEVRKAVHQYGNDLPKGIKRTILVRENNEIHFLPLIPYLKGLPDQRFYMSREAYEIYGEEDRLVPYWLDLVQKAVDAFAEDWGSLPLVPGDPDHKISYAVLEKYYYLIHTPPIEFYLTPYDNLISHRPYKRGEAAGA